jgi:hypothetical protein
MRDIFAVEIPAARLLPAKARVRRSLVTDSAPMDLRLYALRFIFQYHIFGLTAHEVPVCWTRSMEVIAGSRK